MAAWRPKVGFAPTLSEGELVTLAVLSVLLGFTSERRWLRHACADMNGMAPYLPGHPDYNRRLRNVRGLVTHMIRMLAPIECGRSPLRADRMGAVRLLRLPLALLLGTTHAPAVRAEQPAYAVRPIRRAKADEREVLLSTPNAAPDVAATHPQQTIIADRRYYGRAFETELTEHGYIHCAQPTRTCSNGPARHCSVLPVPLIAV
ncbi:hypothetical protein FXF51_09050 [Nonomuraea sp. PA05]|uniref:hypothetical protein n=1 Tax=Nonomuraea sp. PA05 TaxID=2604466 RepID=UPI0011D84BB7|nr:hypothetical protein [Nonomuraea sp. PA05]TYB69354.1 hypothetical protein FXF51_09050 [Nonomuraea sp. PA05]